MSNIIPFPRKPEHREVAVVSPAAAYEFTRAELAKLRRWYSAMKYAFPRIQGIMAVCHEEKVAAIGLYGKGGTVPNCLISKHEVDGRIFLSWVTDHDKPRVIGAISEITEAQIVAIEPPSNEASWLDAAGWMKVMSNRTIGGHLDARSLSTKPA